MRIKVLIAGKNNTVIDDIFVQLTDTMELMTTSMRWDDLMAHVKYYQPSLFCYCIANETREAIERAVFFKRKLGESMPFFVIGSHENCEDFRSIAAGAADVILETPMRVTDIADRMTKYLENGGKLSAEDIRARELDAMGRQERVDAFPSVSETPMSESAAAALASIESLMPEGGGSDISEISAKKRILVVDDSRAMLKTINEQLHNDYEVATAPSGKVALNYLQKKHVDLILLDYEMPEQNGPQVLEKLREDPETKDIPVVFLTGVTERSKIAQALSFQPQGYLLKPIEHEKLIETIENILK